VPRQARATFAGAVPCFAAIWALGGLYLSLGPSLAVQTAASTNLLWGGLVIFLLFGCLFLFAGVAVTFGAIVATASAAFLAGTAVAGIGFGLAYLGCFRIVIALAAPGQRAGLLAAIFIVSYLAFSVPALIAGVATTQFGLRPTALVYSAALAVLIAAAAGILLYRSSGRPTRQAPASRAVMPPGPCTVPPCLQALDERDGNSAMAIESPG
jgi:MFS family permease